jgi:uncharacterized protein (DUF1778 family)
MAVVTDSKRDTLNIRIKPEVRDLIDRAAKARGKNRTDFILDSVRRAAEDALLDKVLFSFNPEAFFQFQERLDLPPKANQNLRTTMQKSAPWDKK